MPQRVLWIESDGALRATVRRLLEADGFAVDESHTGLTGIERALTRPPDLVLADVHLPDMDAFEIATRLKAERTLSSVPFVAVGDSAAQHDLAIAAGCDAFIERPIEESRFRDEVRAILAGKRETLPEAGERAGLRALSAAMASRLENAVAGARGAEARLVERNRLGGIFMRNLAHELSTPITPIAGYLKILASGKVGELAPQQKRIVESVQASLTRLIRIVENLSDFARLQAGQAPIFPAEVDPDSLADEVVADLRAAIKDARLHVTVMKAGGGPVTADPKKLRQALANLVGNAIKFSPHGGEVLVEVQRDGDRLRFSVFDQGPGIPASEQELVFEPFFHATGQDEGMRLPGSGLGLPVARRIAEAHGGRAWLESPPRTQTGSQTRHFTGSKAVIEIPVSPPVQASAP
jgi:signal transduction histidine kinase